MQDIYKFLDEHKIDYQKFEHKAVFTCADVMELDEKMPGVGTKNLFLRDKTGSRHFLVTVGHDKNVDLGELRQIFGVSKLSFGSAERLKEFLGVEPGSVTLLGLINDLEHKVEVVIDKDIWGESLQCHPLVNTASLLIDPDGLERFFAAVGHHQVRIVKIPARS